MGALGYIFYRNDHLTAVLAIPHRNPVPPPQLPRNAPIADVFHPMTVGILPFLRIEHEFAFFPRGKRLVCKRLHFDKPLLRKVRLHNAVAAIAMPDGMLDIFFRFE